MKIRELLQEMVDQNASDIFIVAGLPLTYQVEGRQVRWDAPLMLADTSEVVHAIYGLAGRDINPFLNSFNHDDDYSFAVPGLGRFRVNVFRQRGSLSAIIRIIPFTLPTAEQYHIPEEVMACAEFEKGLVLVTGPAGAGKSTTLACMIDRLNHERSGHIITMEDPIEFVHRHDKCIVTQREIPTDVATYSEALRSAMRESPDIVLLGEMRDYDTIGTAVTAAEMAQLIFSTVLQAVVSQQLVPALDGTEVPAFEVMRVNPAIRNLIREEKTHQIDSVIAANRSAGMRTMDQSLFDLVKEGTIAKDIALKYSIHQEALEKRFAAEGI